MIQTESRLRVADNSGAKELLCIRVLAAQAIKLQILDDVIVCAVKECTPGGVVKKSDVVKGCPRSFQERRKKTGRKLR